MHKSTAMITSVFLIIFFISFFIFRYFTDNKGINLSCNTFIDFRNTKHNFKMKATFTFFFHRDGSGLIIIDGDSMYNSSQNELRKNISFNYIGIGNELYEITDINVSSVSRDATDNKILSEYFFPTADNALKIMTIRRINGIWILGTPLTPAFICTNEEM